MPDPSPSLIFQPPFIAHRGDRAHAPENTMAAFVSARKAGAQWIETDVKLTSDGVPILFHDDLLDRTTSGHGAVADHIWDDISVLDAGGWFAPGFTHTRVPTMAELIAFILESGMRLNLELKPCPGRTRATAMVVLIEAAKLWPVDAPPPLISSFDIEALEIASQLHPEWPRGLLLDQWRDDWRDVADRVDALSIHLDDALVNDQRLAALRAVRKPVLVYTVNNPARATQLLQSGVSAVFTDDPGLFK